MTDSKLKALLDRLATQYNVAGFVDNDPVQFPRRYTDSRDIEISAYLTSIISWGRRSMILRDSERMHRLLGNSPYNFVTEGDIESIPDDNIHRTFFGRHLRYALRGLREVYNRYGSLESLGRKIGMHKSNAPAWDLAKALNAISADIDSSCPTTLTGPTRSLPDKVDT